MDVRDFSSSSTTPFDATDIVADGTGRVFASDVSATSGTTDTAGLVTQFVFGGAATAPEPGSLALLGVAALPFARIIRRRKA